MHIARLFEARFLTEELQIIKDFAHSLVLEYPAHQSQGKLFNPMTCRPWGYYDHLEGWGMLNCWYEHWYLAGNRQWLCPCARNCMPTCRSSFGTYLLETHKHTQTHTNTHTHIHVHMVTRTHTHTHVHHVQIWWRPSRGAAWLSHHSAVGLLHWFPLWRDDWGQACWRQVHCTESQLQVYLCHASPGQYMLAAWDVLHIPLNL